MKLVSETSGPILELGCGMYSTIYLHWACYATKRRLVTCENNPAFFRFAKQFSCDYHDVRLIQDFDKLDLSEPWTIAFVDHAPDTRRKEEIKRLGHADFVVVHDTENAHEKKYRYMEVFRTFASRYKFNECLPYTTVLSNKYDLTNFSVRDKSAFIRDRLDFEQPRDSAASAVASQADEPAG
jgi:hypothetical protein